MLSRQGIADLWPSIVLETGQKRSETVLREVGYVPNMNQCIQGDEKSQQQW